MRLFEEEFCVCNQTSQLKPPECYGLSYLYS